MPWLASWPALRVSSDPSTAAERFFKGAVGREAWDRLPERFRAARRAEGPALLADIGAATAGLDFDLADVLCPVAAAHGSETTPPYVASATAVAGGVYGASLTVIDGASHGVHLTHPAAFAAWIRTVVALAA